MEKNDSPIVCEPMMLASNEDINKILDAIASFEKSVTQKLVSMQVQIDRLAKLMANVMEALRLIESDDNDEKLELLPLNTVKSVNSFEEKLKHAEFRKKVILHLRRTVGTGFSWRSACYKLEAILFTKQVLTLYSWTGVSRNQIDKAPFNKLVNILDVFYSIVRHADASFTHAQKEQFFRDGVLKHSTTRLKPRKALSKSKDQGDDPQNHKKQVEQINGSDSVSDAEQHGDDEIEEEPNNPSESD